MNQSSSPTIVAYLKLLTLGVLLLVIFCHVYFVEGVRGTDQYWYLADVETLANGLPPLTNTVFPGDVLRAGTADRLTYFAHNGPLLHLISWVSPATGPVIAWKYANLLFFLLAALFTGMTVTRLSSAIWGYTSVILFLVTPVHIWLVGNFLQEMFFCFLSAAALYCSSTDEGSNLKKAFLIFVVTVGTLSHPFFLIVGVCCALYLMACRRQWIPALLLLIAIAAASTLKGFWFPTSFPPSIKDLVSASVPGVANSIWQLSDTVPSITPQFLLNKLFHAIKHQFMPSSQTPLYVVTNVGLVALAALALKSLRRIPLFLFVSTVFMICYAGMVVLMQNQVRYQLFITPTAIACTIIWISSWRNLRLVAGLLIVLLMGYLLVDVAMVRKLRNDVRTDSSALAELSEQLSFINAQTRVAMVGNNLGGWLSVIYTLRPSKSMPVFLNVLDDDKFVRVMNLFQPDIILVRDKLPLDVITNAKFLMSLENADLFDLDVYELIEQDK